MPSSHAMRQRRLGTPSRNWIASGVNEFFSAASLQAALHHGIFERADRVDGDANPITDGKSE
jgi:hypothetical protein